MINKQEVHINNEVFKKHFNFQRPTNILKLLYRTNDKEKNIELVNVINSGLKDLKKEIKNMSQEEKEIEKPDKIAELLKRFLSLINNNKEQD